MLPASSSSLVLSFREGEEMLVDCASVGALTTGGGTVTGCGATGDDETTKGSVGGSDAIGPPTVMVNIG
jgi:hypothetical protein